MAKIIANMASEITATIMAVSSSIIGALIYKIYKNEKGEKFDWWAWLRHMIIAGGVGAFIYPYLPEGRMAAGLLSVIGALSLQILTVVDKHGLKLLLKFFNLKVDDKKGSQDQK